MTTRFQACVGPSMNKVHIRDTENPSRLVMCCATTAVRNYKGALVADEHLCERCLSRMFTVRGRQKIPDGDGRFHEEPLTAEMIGVRELV